MTVSPPRRRRKFANDWDQVQYLYDQLLYWLYERQNPGKSRAYALRLKPLLGKVARDRHSILGEECWSLVYEAFGNFRKAIAHRENEIGLIRRLHEASRNSPHTGVVLKDYGYQDLSDRLDLLATLYHDSGALDKAVRVLEESRRLCQQHELVFDAEDLLKEYEVELGHQKPASNAVNGREASRKKHRA